MEHKIEFTFEKNIHMYNHRLTITIDDNLYTGIIEDSPYTANTLLITLDDFNIPNANELLLRTKIRLFFEKEGYHTIFLDGKNV